MKSADRMKSTGCKPGSDVARYRFHGQRIVWRAGVHDSAPPCSQRAGGRRELRTSDVERLTLAEANRHDWDALAAINQRNREFWEGGQRDRVDIVIGADGRIVSRAN